MHAHDAPVLVVDRSSSWGQYVADALEPAGYQVDWTVDFFVALERCDRTRHALAIIDANLGTQRGADLVVALRRRHPSLRVVLTSEAVTDADEDDAHRVGALFMPKVFRRQALLSLVDACLSPIGQGSNG
jgi:DNA-binding response OmpR family regulator